MNKQIVKQIRQNTFSKDYGISRKSFRCLEINIPTAGDWMRAIMAKAEEIEDKLNAGQANSSEKRDEKTINRQLIRADCGICV